MRYLARSFAPFYWVPEATLKTGELVSKPRHVADLI